jgi:hypothetical protein
MTRKLLSVDGKVAIFDTAPAFPGDDPEDPLAGMNRPFASPQDWIANVRFHSDFDYYTVHSDTAVSISHASVAGLVQSGGKGFGANPVLSYGQSVRSDNLLVSHGLPYVPRFIIAQNNRVIPNGMITQRLDNRARIVTFYATSTQIRIVDVGVSSDVALPAITVSYEVIVFREAVTDGSAPLLKLSPGQCIMGQGKVDTTTKTMREGVGSDSPFYISIGRTLDINKGKTLLILPNGEIIKEQGYFGDFMGSPYVRTFVNG